MTTSQNSNAGAQGFGPHPQDEESLVGMRTAFIFLIAALIGLVAAALTHLDGRSTAMALLAGASAAGMSLPVLHKLIAKR
ncbi:hypothetical protein OG806_49845 [Streptomyces sp. NBC_00882]|uniref:hypothetical protein n=1 Tax=Streptomyces sp. NBC_00882 TaxID=2975856 RepID=UPI00386AF6CB|nr:hypothetical protein OG806_00100 [Streptomyces sp. NBC_00882]WSZ36921.1 hypothetical protein OG806_49845 [Streptomyces sp. NBC_00882]